jgi:hypothetical protein
MTFDAIMSRWPWRPIPNCPGRFVLSSGRSSLAPSEIVLASVGAITEHVIPATADPVVVAEFEDGGLISYRKPDGAFIHTLNTIEGLDRKLRQLGIRMLP